VAGVNAGAWAKSVDSFERWCNDVCTLEAWTTRDLPLGSRYAFIDLRAATLSIVNGIDCSTK